MNKQENNNINLFKNKDEMKKNFKLASLALAVIASTTFCACSEDDNNNDNSNNDNNSEAVADGQTITGNVTSDMILGAGRTYYLNGKLQVKAPATLKIEKGVKLISRYNDNISYILIEQGAKIDAQGTAAEPIVMTSERKEKGSWGGLHICGYAPTNAGSGKSEIGDANYGGSKAADNSGVLKYIRLEYTGFALDEEHEANGISFYGVGNGTQVSYVEAYKGGDDGLEFFGGTVNVDHAVAVSCKDDSFDWTEGWSGTASYLVAYQEGEQALGYACDCLIEADNNETNYVATPISTPTLSNLTLVGNGGSKQGIRLRRGTFVKLNNAIVVGKGKALSVESTETETALTNGASKITNTAIAGTVSSEKGIYTNDVFVQGQGNTSGYTPSFTNTIVGMDNGRGAVEASNYWLQGWATL